MKFKKNSLSQLFDLKLPLIQAGMVWVSGGKLAAASASSGILGVIGAGSMKLDTLKEQIIKAQHLAGEVNSHRLAINVPLLYKGCKEQIDLALSLGIKIFFTSAGSPKLYTAYIKDRGAKVVHVTSTPELAQKCEVSGVDAVVAEGFEAGGHNGRDEITTLALIPQVVAAVKIPVIAAGGFYDGRGVLAALALGAQGVQMGTRFVATNESSAHQNFKQAIINAGADSTMLALKKIVPVRLLKNDFYEEIKKLEETCANSQTLLEKLGSGRAKLGMHDGNMGQGELEIGQIAGAIKNIPSVKNLVQEIEREMIQKLTEINLLFSR